MLDREDLDDEERAELGGLAIQEARATARLSHPGIITIFDVIDNDGAPVIVMELIDGRSLAEILKEEVRLPYRRVAEIGSAQLDALREAHAAGVVHRDLKPANVLITTGGSSSPTSASPSGSGNATLRAGPRGAGRPGAEHGRDAHHNEHDLRARLRIRADRARRPGGPAEHRAWTSPNGCGTRSPTSTRSSPAATTRCSPG
jgi:serine/threonine protein kinase